MNNDKLFGAGILLGSMAGVAVYFWLIFISAWSWLTIQISAFAALAMVLLMIAWIGYTLATTPPPAPLENFDFEEESEENTE